MANAAERYTIQWSRFDNASATHQDVGAEQTVTSTDGAGAGGAVRLAAGVRRRRWCARSMPISRRGRSRCVVYFRRTGDRLVARRPRAPVSCDVEDGRARASSSRSRSGSFIYKAGAARCRTSRSTGARRRARAHAEPLYRAIGRSLPVQVPARVRGAGDPGRASAAARSPSCSGSPSRSRWLCCCSRSASVCRRSCACRRRWLVFFTVDRARQVLRARARARQVNVLFAVIVTLRCSR